MHIQSPHEREWEFVNRMGCHSINVQLVGNADLIITNYVVWWPGCVHNACILKEKNLYHNFQQTVPDGILLCSSSYPLLPWLMTLFATITCDSRQGYNNVHGTTRGQSSASMVYSSVDLPAWTISVWSMQACYVICACIVLRNIAQTRRVPLHEDHIDLLPKQKALTCHYHHCLMEQCEMPW